MRKKSVKFILLALALALVMAVALSGCGGGKDNKPAPKFPTKPINMIIAFTAGGSSDVQARIVDKYWKDEFGSNLSFQYKIGAGGQVGFTDITKAPKDGYTVGGVNVPHIVLQALSPQATFKIEDFTMLCQVVNDPQVVAVRKESSIKTLADLLKEAKAKDGKMTMGIVGTYTGHHVAALKFMDLTGTRYSLVPFQGAADQNVALLGGHVEVMIGNLNDIMRDLGKFNILGIAAEKRHPYIKDVATFKEQKMDFVADIRRGFAVPKGTDPAAVTRLREGFAKICAKPEYIADMEKIGQPSEYMSGEDFEKYINGYNKEATMLLDKFGLLKK